MTTNCPLQHIKPRVAENREKLRRCLKGEQTPGVQGDLWLPSCGVWQEAPSQSQLVQERRAFFVGWKVEEMFLRRQRLLSLSGRNHLSRSRARCCSYQPAALHNCCRPDPCPALPWQCSWQEVWCAVRCWSCACSLVRAAWERQCPGCDSQPSCRVPAQGRCC